MKKNHYFGVVAIFFAFNSQAAPLVSWSDSNSTLEWLSPNETTGLSYNKVISLTSPGAILAGWRYATLSEWKDMMTFFGFDVDHSFYIGNPSFKQRTAMKAAAAALGNGSQTNDANDLAQGGLLGSFNALGDVLNVYWSLDDCLNEKNCGTPQQISTYGQYFTDDSFFRPYHDKNASTYFGSYLVREQSIPEPSLYSLAILPLGFLVVRSFMKNKPTLDA